MKYINCGCGAKYSTEPEWINIDFNSCNKDVKSVNILKDLPFEDNSIDVIFSSCMLEHFTKEQGEQFIKECKRVLKINGIIRIVVPDLENVTREYLSILEKVKQDDSYKSKYDYITIELLEQMCRSKSGGEMVKYWNRDDMDLDYVTRRTGFPEEWNVNHNSAKYRRITNIMKIKDILVEKGGKLLQ